MQPNEIVAAEKRRRGLVLAAGLLGFVLTLAGQFIQAIEIEGDGDAALLLERADFFDRLLAGSIVSAIGFLLLTVPVFLLFLAAQNRSGEMRRGLGPLIPLGGAFLAIYSVTAVIAIDNAAADFLAGTPTTGDAGEERADEILADSGLYATSGWFGLAGLFALAVGTLYASLHAMRTGLVTRFLGTLGMALAVVMVLTPIFGPLGLFIFILWSVAITFVVSGRWIGGVPEAWEAGKAVPLATPGQPAPRPESRAEEPARPEDFETVDGTATEVESTRPARRDNKRKRKRKARG